jgi:thiamine pyrophosphate-dependent acetolactate synthase large subunit-like protein
MSFPSRWKIFRDSSAVTPAVPLPASGEEWVGPADTAADIIVDKLIDWGVGIVFGLAADAGNPLIYAIQKRKDKIRFIAAQQARSPAFMASGYAQYTGRLGVCLAAPGSAPAAIWDGLYDASLEGAAVLAITDADGTAMQDFLVYDQKIAGPLQALTVVDLACRAALTTPGAAHITVAADVQTKPLREDKPSPETVEIAGSSSFQPQKNLSDREDQLEPSVWPDHLATTVSRLMNADALVAVEAGAHTVFNSRYWQATGNQQVLLCSSATPISGSPAQPAGSMANDTSPGLPYALAAQIAYPYRQCIAVVNDNSLAALAEELRTAVSYSLPVKIIVLKKEQQPMNFVKMAEGYGLEAFNCKHPGELRSALLQAFAAPGAALVEVEMEN